MEFNPFFKLSPAGNFESPLALLCSNDTTALQEQISSLYTQKEVIFFNSGKNALFSLFKILKQRKGQGSILVSEYTCPDIACSAVRAGLKIRPLPINSKTLEPDFLSCNVSSDIVAVVLSNLYGLVDSIHPAKDFCSRIGAILIDDACQAALSADESGYIGGRKNSIGVSSFGRGKAICGVGGGALLIPQEEKGLAQEISSNTSFAPQSIASEIYDFLKNTFMWIAEHPFLYGIPSSLPLGIGETVCSTTFPVTAPTHVSLAIAKSKLKNILCERRERKKKAAQWGNILSDFPITRISDERKQEDSSLIRYPILFEKNETRNAVYHLLKPLGASLSYPHYLHQFPELKDSLIPTQPPADNINDRILTLPTHAYVNNNVFNEALRRLKKYFNA